MADNPAQESSLAIVPVGSPHGEEGAQSPAPSEADHTAWDVIWSASFDDLTPAQKFWRIMAWGAVGAVLFGGLALIPHVAAGLSVIFLGTKAFAAGHLLLPLICVGIGAATGFLIANTTNFVQISWKLLTHEYTDTETDTNSKWFLKNIVGRLLGLLGFFVSLSLPFLMIPFFSGPKVALILGKISQVALLGSPAAAKWPMVAKLMASINIFNIMGVFLAVTYIVPMALKAFMGFVWESIKEKWNAISIPSHLPMEDQKKLQKAINEVKKPFIPMSDAFNVDIRNYHDKQKITKKIAAIKIVFQHCWYGTTSDKTTKKGFHIIIAQANSLGLPQNRLQEIAKELLQTNDLPDTQFQQWQTLWDTVKENTGHKYPIHFDPNKPNLPLVCIGQHKFSANSTRMKEMIQWEPSQMVYRLLQTTLFDNNIAPGLAQYRLHFMIAFARTFFAEKPKQTQISTKQPEAATTLDSLDPNSPKRRLFNSWNRACNYLTACEKEMPSPAIKNIFSEAIASHPDLP